MTINTTTSNYKGVIFDLDGTLVDSLFDLGSSMNAVLLTHHLPIHSMDKYKIFVGNGMRKLVERALPKDHLDQTDFYLDKLLEVYSQNCLRHTQCYAGIHALLKQLMAHDIPLSIITNKKHELTAKIVEDLMGDIHFTSIVGDLFDGKRKPDPYHTVKCIDEMGLKSHEVLFVGDSNVDIETALNAGMDACGVLWGFRTETELREAGATHIAKSPKDVYNIIV